MKNTKRAIKNGQSGDICNVGHKTQNEDKQISNSNSNSKFVLSLSNTVCDNYTNYTNKHVTKQQQIHNT